MRTLEFEGIIFPPNDEIRIPGIRSGFSGKDTDAEGYIDFSIVNSVVFAKVKLKKYEGSFGNIRNSIEYFINTSLDAYGYYYGTAHEIKLGICIEDGKNMYTINPGAAFLKDDRESRPLKPKELIKILHECPYLMDVFSNFRKAIKYSEDRGFFCYRTIESMLQHYKDVHNCKDKKGWGFLRNCLNISKDYLLQIKDFSEKPRHGKFPSITDEDNQLILGNTIKIIDRFVLYVHSGDCLKTDEFPQLTANN